MVTMIGALFCLVIIIYDYKHFDKETRIKPVFVKKWIFDITTYSGEHFISDNELWYLSSTNIQNYINDVNYFGTTKNTLVSKNDIKEIKAINTHIKRIKPIIINDYVSTVYTGDYVQANKIK